MQACSTRRVEHCSFCLRFSGHHSTLLHAIFLPTFTSVIHTHLAIAKPPASNQAKEQLACTLAAAEPPSYFCNNSSGVNSNLTVECTQQDTSWLRDLFSLLNYAWSHVQERTLHHLEGRHSS